MKKITEVIIAEQCIGIVVGFVLGFLLASGIWLMLFGDKIVEVL